MWLKDKRQWRFSFMYSLLLWACDPPAVLSVLPVDYLFCSFLNLHFIAGIPGKIDPAALPLAQPAASWVWLVDLERAVALLVGADIRRPVGRSTSVWWRERLWKVAQISSAWKWFGGQRPWARCVHCWIDWLLHFLVYLLSGRTGLTCLKHNLANPKLVWTLTPA